MGYGTMDAEEIANMVKELKLTKEAGDKGVVITDEEAQRGKEKLNRMVVGKVFARRPVNKELLRIHLPKILHARGGMEIELMGHNMYMVTFALEVDKRVALEEGPWHFFQDLMVIKETQPMQTITEIEFDEISLWIQCHNIPMACMATEIMKRVGEKVGRVHEIDEGEGGLVFGKTVRMRISRRIDEPLVRCVPVKLEKTEDETLIIIQYEKLPHFCYKCGRIGHIQKDCGEGEGDKEGMLFDNRLRAGRFLNTQSHRSLVMVAKNREEDRSEGGRGDSRVEDRGVRDYGGDGGGKVAGEVLPSENDDLNDKKHTLGEESLVGEGSLEGEGESEGVMLLGDEENRQEGFFGNEGVNMVMERGSPDLSPDRGKEILTGASGKKGENKSPSKKNKKEGGGKWKRRAREAMLRGLGGGEGERGDGERR